MNGDGLAPVNQAEISFQVRILDHHVRIANDVHARIGDPVEGEIHLARTLRRNPRIHPADIGRRHRIRMEAKREVVVPDVVFPGSGDFAAGKNSGGFLPPEGIAREVKRAHERPHVRLRWAEWLRDHAQRSYVCMPNLVRRIFKPEKRDLCVDVMERRNLLVAVRNFHDEKTSLGPHRRSNDVGFVQVLCDPRRPR